MGLLNGGASWDEDEDIRDDDGPMFGGSERFEERKRAKEQIMQENLDNGTIETPTREEIDQRVKDQSKE